MAGDLFRGETASDPAQDLTLPTGQRFDRARASHEHTPRRDVSDGDTREVHGRASHS
jgi:hypothetical protein